MADEKLKIVVFGAFGAGKTTLIKTLDPASKHIEANCAGGTTTVALDFGRIHQNGYEIYIYGTPGQERFGFAREIISRGMDGAVLLVDGTVPPEEFTFHLSDTLHAAKVPFVVFLNKCDDGRADPTLFDGRFGSSATVAVSAKNRSQCLAAILEFAGTLKPHKNGRS